MSKKAAIGRQSPLRLIKRCVEFVPFEETTKVPPGLRGFYVLYKGKNVVYVGMTTGGAGGKGGIKARLRVHRRKKHKLWTHASIYEVWDNIRDEEIAELEGLFRHIYRYDATANKLNAQRGFSKIRSVEKLDF